MSTQNSTQDAKSKNSNTKKYLCIAKMSGGSCDDHAFVKHDIWCQICTSKVQILILKGIWILILKHGSRESSET
jgi:hypothetical protein